MKQETQQAITAAAPTLYPPAPWVACGCTVYEVDKWKDGVNEGGRFVAVTVDPDFLEMPTEEMQDRAQALAAFPELLAVCIRFAEYCKQHSAPELQGIACDAFAAIAKARGAA